MGPVWGVMLSWDLGHNLDENHRLREKVGQSNLNRCQTNPPRDVITRCCSRCLEDALTRSVQGSDWVVTESKQSRPALLCALWQKRGCLARQ